MAILVTTISTFDYMLYLFIYMLYVYHSDEKTRTIVKVSTLSINNNILLFAMKLAYIIVLNYKLSCKVVNMTS